jgi:glutamate synthase domain-containing protein 3
VSGWHSQTRDGERESDEAILKRLIERHFKHTGSTRARNLLDDWAEPAAASSSRCSRPTTSARWKKCTTAAWKKPAEKIAA